MDFILPSRMKKEDGNIRQVGYELEFGNLELEQVSQFLLKTYGGSHSRLNRFNHKLEGTKLGDFNLESDTRLLSEKMYQDYLKKMGLDIQNNSFLTDNLEESLESLLASIINLVIPYEIVFPPIPMDKMQEAEAIRHFLYTNSAQGTKSSPSYVFGMHINPELPELNLESLLNYLKAFLLLYPWLEKVSEIDWTRRLSSYINPFPEEYINLVFSPNYKPTPEIFIKDYHQYNPDRNRPLDLYPILMWLWEDEISQYPSVKWVSKRPTLHYRLPNSLIGQADWSLSQEWNRWVKVEELANQTTVMKEMISHYLSFYKNSSSNRDKEWLNVLNKEYQIL